MNIVRSYFVPGTPREIEFRCYKSPFQVDLEIGNDLDKLRINERVQRSLSSRRPNSTSTTTDTEADSISDESGYHDEKSSLEEEEDDILIENNNALHIMSMKPERHVAYAVQWFMLAGTLFILYLFVSIKKRNKED